MKGASGTVGKMKSQDGEWVFLFDHGTPTVYADLVTEVAEKDGIVRLSFAAITQDGDGIPKANIVARLRMPKDMAWELCRSIKALDQD